MRLSIAADGAHCAFEIDAPDHGDPRPARARGPCDGLWDFEVVELFVADAGERYFELEVGPGGHFLALRLDGVRQVVERVDGLALAVEAQGGRWRARAAFPRAWLPEAPARWNAYAIHGTGDARRYLAWQAPGGQAPDFHRLDAFAPLPATFVACATRATGNAQ